MIKFTRQDLRDLIKKLEIDGLILSTDKEYSILVSLVKKHLVDRYGEGKYDKRRSTEEG